MSTHGTPLVTLTSNADIRLTDVERQLLANFRAMKPDAHSDVIAITAEWARTMPAKRVRLSLVGRPK